MVQKLGQTAKKRGNLGPRNSPICALQVIRLYWYLWPASVNQSAEITKLAFFLSARTSFVSKTYLLGDISMKMSNKTIISDCNILPLCKTPLLDWNSNIGVKILPNTATSLPNIVSSKIEICICFAKLKACVYMVINQIFEWKRAKYNFSLWTSFSSDKFLKSCFQFHCRLVARQSPWWGLGSSGRAGVFLARELH